MQNITSYNIHAGKFATSQQSISDPPANLTNVFHKVTATKAGIDRLAEMWANDCNLELYIAIATLSCRISLYLVTNLQWWNECHKTYSNVMWFCPVRISLTTGSPVHLNRGGTHLRVIRFHLIFEKKQLWKNQPNGFFQSSKELKTWGEILKNLQ